MSFSPRRFPMIGLSFVGISVLAIQSSAHSDTLLQNSVWSVRLNPATLAMTVSPSQAAPVVVSDGVKAHKVSGLKSTSTTANWQWEGGAYDVETKLLGRDLSLSIQAKTAGQLTILNQPPKALRHGLILPLAEGHYYPTSNTLAAQFLSQKLGECNTTEDLSLPLWGLDQGKYALHWILTNPYNNTLNFKTNGTGLQLTASHQFTSLAPKTPMTLMLHLGGADLLGGAKRYRDWLIAKKQYESLQSKIAKNGAGQKLLGATHIYLWGNELFAPSDVKSWPNLLAILRGKNPFVDGLTKRFEPEAREVIAQAASKPYQYQQKVLIGALNAALTATARESWQVAIPNVGTLANRYSELRQQVALVFGAALKPDPAQWGGGLSIATIEKLRAAGLSRLWIGLGDGWEGGLWHPEAVAAAVKAGYLIGPYDSYETALPVGLRPDWATANLGEKAYRNFGIMLQDGTLKSGFQKMGHYTDTRLMMPLLKARVQAIGAKAGFNSWFLDAYGAGMVFDSYRPGATLTQAQNAAANENASRWLSESLHLPAGSEGGNAITAGGIMFAHGMQTPVIGWGDSQMFKEKQSPYYLGAWYPAEEPAVFFKPVPMKEPYRTLYFDPAMRLPLYQAVFHGSVISGHHWSYDNLKLSNVHAESELTQLLYNVPPMYHLSAGSLGKRLPLIQRQNAFFRPLHTLLATTPLTDFRRLAPDGLLQETVFANKARLIANFDTKTRSQNGRNFPAQSVTALLHDGSVRVYTAASSTDF